jgi:tetrapyrrole methylase family protein / MazG family protein
VAARPHVTVVGLGPAGPDLLGDRAAALLRSPHAYLRTSRHPATAALGGVASFDELYETAATFEDVYLGIVDSLVTAALAAAPEPVIYAVPGSPLVSERTVELLRSDGRVDLSIVPALSFLDLAWAALGIDPLTEGVRLADAAADRAARPGPGPVLVAQCWSRQVLSDLKLRVDDGGPVPPQAVVLHHLGLEDECVRRVDWWDLDRTVDPDHLTSVYIPAWPGAPPGPVAESGAEVARLVSLMDTLRVRCPWDRAQTHVSLMPHLVEECYEVLDALAALAEADKAHVGEVAGEVTDEVATEVHEAAAHLREELGDLLFQIVFHARLADEDGQFDLAEVARGVHDKLVHRHPHVFAGATVDDAAAVMANWEDIKKAEKGRRSVTDGIPTALPALLLATTLARKARAVGIDPLAGSIDSAPAALSVLEDKAASRAPHPDDPLSSEEDDGIRQIGDVLMTVAVVAQTLGIDPEHALRDRALALRAQIRAAEGVPDGENRNR